MPLQEIVEGITAELPEAGERGQLAREAAERAERLARMDADLAVWLPANLGRGGPDPLYLETADAIARRSVADYLELCRLVRGGCGEEALHPDDIRAAASLGYRVLLCMRHALHLLPGAEQANGGSPVPRVNEGGHVVTAEEKLKRHFPTRTALEAGGVRRTPAPPDGIPEDALAAALTILRQRDVVGRGRFGPVRCLACAGRGYADSGEPGRASCPDCGGTGRIQAFVAPSEGWEDGPRNDAMALEALQHVVREGRVRVVALLQHVVRAKLAKARRKTAGALESGRVGADILTLETLAICAPQPGGRLFPARVLDEPLEFGGGQPGADDVDGQLDAVARAATRSLRTIEKATAVEARLVLLEKDLPLGRPLIQGASTYRDVDADAWRAANPQAPSRILVRPDGSDRIDPADLDGWAIATREGSVPGLETRLGKRHAPRRIRRFSYNRGERRERWLVSMPDDTPALHARAPKLVPYLLDQIEHHAARFAPRMAGHRGMFDGKNDDDKVNAVMRMLLAHSVTEDLARGLASR